jgi:UPF0755 protein
MSISIRTKRTVFFVSAFLLLAGVLLTAGVVRFLVQPSKSMDPDQIFIVHKGSTLREVIDDLEKKGIIANKAPLLLWSRLSGHGTRIKAGEYRLNGRMAPLGVLQILGKGNIITHPVTIPEGFTIKQIAEALDKKGLAEKNRFSALAEDPDVAMRYGIPGPSLEGYLYPDTYLFGRGQSDISIIDVMVRRFFEVIRPFKKRIGESGMTLQQVVIMASLIEKETGQGEERPVIASVFLNRLKRGMRLESDPTVIYGIRDFNGNLTRKDLSQSTPYNTYVIRGLPLGPIANPGEEAIKAVLYPADTEYLYFVSKNNGRHHFSKTLREHNRAVKIYQKKGRRNRLKTS